MEDLPIPETGGEAIGIFVVVAIIAGLYVLIRRTQQSHYERYWRERRFHDRHRLAEPDDPSQLPTEWERVEDRPEDGREGDSGGL